MKTASTFISLILLTALSASCSVENRANYLNVYGKWALVEVAYSDGSKKVFEKNSGNYVEIGKTFVVEIMAESGETNYAYTQQGKHLNLLAGDEIVTWVISRLEKNEIEIDTPVGRYCLSRHSEDHVDS